MILHPLQGLPAALSDSLITEHHHAAFERLIHVDADSAARHLLILKQLSKGDHLRSKFLYDYDLGYYLFIQHDLDSSLFHFQKALAHAQHNDLKEEAVKAKIWYANHMFFRNEKEVARKVYQEVIDESTGLKYVDGIANGYYGLADLSSDEEKILLLHLKIDSLYRAHGTVGPILANSLGAIGRIYLESNFIESAKEYYEKSFAIARKTNYLPGLSNANEVRGKIELHQKNFAGAEEYFMKALAESRRKHDTPFIAHNLVNLASVDLARKDFAGAIDTLETAREYYNLIKDSVSLTNVSLLLANCYIGLGNLSKAKGHLDYADSHPKYLSEDDYRISLWETSINYNKAKGSFATAFELMTKLEEIKTDIQNRRNNIAFIEFERKHSLERTRQQIELLNSENSLLEQQRKNQLNLFLGGIALALLAGVSLFILLRNRQRTAKKLRELDNLKSRFFANISHEFRTPLTLISGLLEQRLNSDKISESDRDDLERIDRHSKRLLELVTQLLDLSRLNSGEYKLRIAKGNLSNLFRAIAESFQIIARQKDVFYEVSVYDLQEAWFDKDVIEKVTTNLLSNAFKYTETNGRVNVWAYGSDKDVRIVVENTAGAIHLNNVDKFFDRFYQADSRMDGAGIGLSLVKELVNINRGSIEVNKTPENILQFTVVLPIERSAYRSSELTKQFSFGSAVPGPTILESQLDIKGDNPTGDSEGNILLVVEDEMEVRQLIKDSFSDQYRVVEAANGKEGIELALKWVPNLVISDIRMPVFDGFELCSKLKTDERTSHIPVILLTAKAGEEDQYTGLSYGADAYITKPFRIRLLKTRVNKLIESRQALREHYRQEVVLKPHDIAITSFDKKFLQRVQDVLNHRLTESSFTTQEFSLAVGMSRMQLHRKLKALTGLSASEFVRSQRLELAKTLLQKSDANVSEIGYQVGFNDPSYFTKCFREAYGVSPSRYSNSRSF